MVLRDMLILAGFALVCTLLYLACCLPVKRNRSKAGLGTTLLGVPVILLLTGLVWYAAFASPLSRNWGLGGAYLWMAVCPALYLVGGLTVTIHNLRRKENCHD